MRLKIFLFFAALIWLNSSLVSSQVITLSEIQKMAEANYPAIARYDIIEKTKDFSIANANRGFLPQGTVSA
ncbi:MAG TPA: transporter, partial [Porphyromonadaceae bacterium]|nr:transporter [Porphyromonadaceae bacterium]